jgi:hypothetical protein
MKRILIGTALFILGLVIGSAATGTFVKNFYQDQAARLYTFNVGADALLAQQLRAGLTPLILEQTDRRIVTGILELHQNPNLKDLPGTHISLTAAKEYYTCSKIPFPPEITHILTAHPPVPSDRCSTE